LRPTEGTGAREQCAKPTTCIQAKKHGERGKREMKVTKLFGWQTNGRGRVLTSDKGVNVS